MLPWGVQLNTNVSEKEDLTFMLPMGVQLVKNPLTFWTSSLEVTISNLLRFNGCRG